MGKCLVCGKPAILCCPLTFCDECKLTPAADEVRKRHRQFFEEIIAKRNSTSGLKEES